MLLLTVLPTYVLLTTTVLLSVLAVLSMLGLLLLQRCSIWLQHNAIHSTAQCVLSS